MSTLHQGERGLFHILNVGDESNVQGYSILITNMKGIRLSVLVLNVVYYRHDSI